jgi:hypothetical protein
MMSTSLKGFISRRPFRFSELFRANLREDAAEKNVDQIAALAHDLASARAG